MHHQASHMGVYSLNELEFEAKIGAGFFGNVYRVWLMASSWGWFRIYSMRYDNSQVCGKTHVLKRKVPWPRKQSPSPPLG